MTGCTLRIFATLIDEIEDDGETDLVADLHFRKLFIMTALASHHAEANMNRNIEVTHSPMCKAQAIPGVNTDNPTAPTPTFTTQVATATPMKLKMRRKTKYLSLSRRDSHFLLDNVSVNLG
jgi:hypothetical protein